MLDQLVVSNGQRKERRTLRFVVLGTATLMLMGCFSVFVWSIMAMELSLTEEGLELSTLVAPVPIPAAEPPKPEPQRAEPKPQAQQSASKAQPAIRREMIARPEEHQEAPNNVSVVPNTSKARPESGGVKVVPNGIETDAVGANNSNNRDGVPGGGPGSPTGTGTVASNTGDKGEDPPVMIKKEPVEVKKPPVQLVHSNIINSKAISLPKPNYPPPAIAVNAGGEVSIKVLLDEDGNVISAQAINGHPMLKQPAVTAARNAKFTPTYLNGQKVRVTGTIIYRFSRA